jgi:hypothetical protein
LGDVLIPMTVSSKEDDAGAEHDLLGRETGPYPLLEAGNFAFRQRNEGSFAWHALRLRAPGICVAI